MSRESVNVVSPRPRRAKPGDSAREASRRSNFTLCRPRRRTVEPLETSWRRRYSLTARGRGGASAMEEAGAKRRNGELTDACLPTHGFASSGGIVGTPIFR